MPLEILQIIEKNKSLRELSPIGIGGITQHFAQPPDESTLGEILSFANQEGLKIRILGACSNILFSEAIFKGLILRLGWHYIKEEGGSLRVSAGVSIPSLLNYTVENGLWGLEFLAGIPGTVGGAIKNNASTLWGSIQDVLESIRVMDFKGNIKILQTNDIEFSYHSSGVKDCIILEGRFKLKKKDTGFVKKRVLHNFLYRKNTHPLDKKTLGCVFRNPWQGLSAGRLIEKVGLKGERRGGVTISRKHANFFEVEDGAKFEDFYGLLNWVRERVKEKENILLHPEIEIWKD